MVYFCQGQLLQSYENSRKFKASVTERCTSLTKRSGIFRQNLLKVLVKKLNLSKTFTTLLQKRFLRFPVGVSQQFTSPPIYLSTYLQNLFVSYKAHVFCIRIHIYKRFYFPLLLFLRWKVKEK